MLMSANGKEYGNGNGKGFWRARIACRQSAHWHTVRAVWALLYSFLRCSCSQWKR